MAYIVLIIGIVFAYFGGYRLIGLTKGTIFDGSPWEFMILGFALTVVGLVGLHVTAGRRREPRAPRKG